MVNVKHFVDEGIENLEKGAKQQFKSTAQSIGSQVTGGKGNQASDSGTNESGSNAASQQGNGPTDQVLDETSTKDVVAAFYAQSASDKQQGSDKKPSDFVVQQIQQGKSPEEAGKLESLRKKLHDETYYIPLTRRKPLEEEQKQEEQVEEKEKKMEELKLEEKKKQDDDIAIKMATQKTEKFPGASG